MKKKRVNLYLSADIKKELELKLKKNGMSYGNYFTHLILKEKEREKKQSESNELLNDILEQGFKRYEKANNLTKTF